MIQRNPGFLSIPWWIPFWYGKCKFSQQA